MIMDHKEKNVKKINVVKSYFLLQLLHQELGNRNLLSEVLSAESMKLDKLNVLLITGI